MQNVQNIVKMMTRSTIPIAMHATVTEDIELVFRWCENGEATVRFALVSSSEFSIYVNVQMNSDLNYQGMAMAAFETCCYGCDLKQFGLELTKLAQGGTKSARFINTGGDFEIRIEPREQDGRCVMFSELRYSHSRSIDEVWCHAELVLPVGSLVNAQQVATSIEEMIRLSKVDCRTLFELPVEPPQQNP
jgi:hypothetical protein